jgi:hypothetical protein
MRETFKKQLGLGKDVDDEDMEIEYGEEEDEDDDGLMKPGDEKDFDKVLENEYADD